MASLSGASGPAGPDSANAVAKVLRVLDGLADHTRVAELAGRTGLPKSTVHRILQTLVAEGFAAYDEDAGSYTPGARLLALAGRTLRRVDVATGGEPVLRRLQERTGATVHLAVLAGDEAVYVRKLEGDKPYRMVSRVGMAIPLHCTAIGKAILAGLPEDDAVALLRRTGLPARTPGTLTTVQALLADLAEVRGRGWSRDDEENEVGVVCVGAAVRDHTGRTVGAVSVSQLASDPQRLAAEDLGPQVSAAAAEVSAAFGAPARTAS
jgi:IclR family acetate operon transcriptional repressor